MLIYHGKAFAKSGMMLDYKIFDTKIVRTFINKKETRVVGFSGESEFVVCAMQNGEPQLFSSRDCSIIVNQNAESNSVRICFEHDLFEVDLSYIIKEGIFRKLLTFKAKANLFLKSFASEIMRTSAPLARGGEGQPVFISDEMFAGIEFPAANNSIIGDQLYFTQSPYIEVKAGNCFELFSVVFGFSNHESLACSFESYIKENALQTTKGIKIYCDWGLHDELSDNINLDEKMTLDMIDRLTEIKRNFDIKFDYYLMDAFWFEEGQPYIEFKKSCWPNGISEVTKKLEKENIKFGLWFDTNMRHAKIVEHSGSVRGNNSLEFCLSDEQNIMLLKNAIKHQIKNNHIKMVKLDFTYFECDNPNHSFHARGGIESKEPAVRGFISMIGELKQIEPELVFLAYNGITTDLSWLGAVIPDKRGYAVSPWWAFYLDYIYCGDPRASEIASSDLRSSIIYYTDAMVWQFKNSLMPLEFVDDHGTMVGNTGTIYCLEKKNFRDSWIMNISRGGKKLHFYGDLGLLDSEDLQFMKECEKMHSDISDPQYSTRMILDTPLCGKPYGYSSSNGVEGYITIVNPSTACRTVNVNIKEWSTIDTVDIDLWYSSNKAFPQNENFLINGVLQAKVDAQTVQVYQWKVSARSDNHVYRIVIESGDKLALPVHKETVTIIFNFSDENEMPLRTGDGIPLGLSLVYEEKLFVKPRDSNLWSGISWIILQKKPDSLKKDSLIQFANSGVNKIIISWKEITE